MAISIGLILILGTIIFLIGLVVFLVIRNRIQREDTSQEFEQPARAVNKSAVTSLILGVISFPPSLCCITIMVDAALQGGGSDSPILLVLLCMAPVGLASMILGVRALGDLSRNRMAERGKAFAIAGIVLGLPGLILMLYLVFGFIFSRLNHN